MPSPFLQPLISAEQSRSNDHFSLDASTFPVAVDTSWSVRHYTLRGGLQEGVEVVEIDNGRLRFAVLPTRGMGIWRGEDRGVRLGWDSPVRHPVHPAFVNLQERGGLGWLRGFNEWIVRCGLSSMGAPGTDAMRDNNGNPAEETLTLHGKIANLPARTVDLEVTEREIILRGEVEETMLFGPALRLHTEIRTAFNSSALSIEDTVTNLESQPAEHQLLYHINYGPPLLEAGSRFACPFRRMAPRDARAAEGVADYPHFGAPESGFVEQCYYFEPAGHPGTGETLALLRNASGERGSAVRYGVGDFPCFALWKNTGSLEDGYVTGLEPATAFPNARQFEREQGRVLTLAAGETRRTRLRVESLATVAEVQAVEAEIADLQGTVEPELHARPIPQFSRS